MCQVFICMISTAKSATPTRTTHLYNPFGTTFLNNHILYSRTNVKQNCIKLNLQPAV